MINWQPLRSLWESIFFHCDATKLSSDSAEQSKNYTVDRCIPPHKGNYICWHEKIYKQCITCLISVAYADVWDVGDWVSWRNSMMLLFELYTMFFFISDCLDSWHTKSQSL